MIQKLKNYWNKKNLKDKSYSYLFEPNKNDEYICFDCETTGLDRKNDEIISIGALLIQGNKIITSKKFERFIKTDKKSNKEAIKIHQLRDIDIQAYTNTIDDSISDFLSFIGNRPLVGYYLNFDVAMVNKHIKQKIGINLPNKQIEVADMYVKHSNKFFNNDQLDLSFNSITKKLSIPIMAKHDAINDAIMTAMIFLKLKNSLPNL